MLSKKSTRRITANSQSVVIYYKALLKKLKTGNPVGAIKLINSRRPVDDLVQLLGRPLSVFEATQYLEAMHNVEDSKLRLAIGIAKQLQDTRTNTRKALQYHTLDGVIPDLEKAIRLITTYNK